MDIIYVENCSPISNTEFWLQIVTGTTNLSALYYNEVKQPYDHCNIDDGNGGGDTSGENMQDHCFFYSPTGCISDVFYDKPSCYTASEALIAMAALEESENITLKVISSLVEALKLHKTGVAYEPYSTFEIVLDHMGTVNRDTMLETETEYGINQLYCQYATHYDRQLECISVQDYVDANIPKSSHHSFENFELWLTQSVLPMNRTVPMDVFPMEPKNYAKVQSKIYKESEVRKIWER